MEINCVFAPTMSTPDHIALAEKIGYERAWVYDSPTIYADSAMTLGFAAAKTSTIRLGISVITEHLRHLATNAALVAYLSTLAPDLGVGSGFTSAALLGKKPSKWADVERYIRALRGLLRGEEVEWNGAVLKLQHGDRSGVRLPGAVPIFVSAHGPKGIEVARRVGDGVVTNPTHRERISFEGPVQLTYYGTVMEDGEAYNDPRVIDAAGPGAALALHLGKYGPLAGMPEATGHGAAIEAIAEEKRLSALHLGHLIEPNDIDLQFLTGDVVQRGTLTGTRAEIGEKLLALQEEGASGVLYQPGGSDIPRELEAFFDAAQDVDFSLSTTTNNTEETEVINHA